MDIRSIPSEIDLRLNLLSGESLFYDNIEVKPYTLREINKMGYSNYMRSLGVLTIEKRNITNDDSSLDKYSVIELISLSKN